MALVWFERMDAGTWSPGGGFWYQAPDDGPASRSCTHPDNPFSNLHSSTGSFYQNYFTFTSIRYIPLDCFYFFCLYPLTGVMKLHVRRQNANFLHVCYIILEIPRNVLAVSGPGRRVRAGSAPVRQYKLARESAITTRN